MHRSLTVLVSGAALSLVAGLPVYAQSAPTAPPEPVQALLACRQIEDAEARLTCQDTELQAFEAALLDGRLMVVQREAVRAVERESFGIQMPSVEGLGQLFAWRAADAAGEPEVETLETGGTLVYRTDGGVAEMRNIPVESLDYTARNALIVTLSNGQVWVQTDSTRIQRVRGRRLETLTADIERGALSAYYMRLSHTPHRVRVRRRD